MMAFLTQEEINEPGYEKATRLTTKTMSAFLATVNKAKSSTGV